MKRLAVAVGYGVAVAVISHVAASAIIACASSKPATYAAELQACVASASTKAESVACRCGVSTRYGRPCDDGGAP